MTHDNDFCHRLPGSGNGSPHTGHTLTVALTTAVSLHLGHLTG